MLEEILKKCSSACNTQIFTDNFLKLLEGIQMKTNHDKIKKKVFELIEDFTKKTLNRIEEQENNNLVSKITSSEQVIASIRATVSVSWIIC